MANNDFYPTGVYAEQSNLNGDTNLDENNPGNDPSWVSQPVLTMSEAWTPIEICMGGTQVFRKYARTLLPQEPREFEDAWVRRVSHATLPPYTTRIAEQAAGLVLRKAIQLQPKTEGGEVDPYWTEDFALNVDGYGTDLDAWVRRLAISSILIGHAGVIVDYPTTEPAPNLGVERQMGLRPYFIQVDAPQILGWRLAEGSPTAPIEQVRIKEVVHEPLGAFGDREVVQIRVLQRDSWRVFRKSGEGWYVHQEGALALDRIPMAVTYSNKYGELTSKPPLLSIADLNILFAQRSADLQFSLHVSAMPILVLKGFDDSDSEIALSSNSAILLPTDGAAEMVEPASSSFEAQQNYLKLLEEQMASLGISTLFAQKQVGETAESKRLSRTDSDSLLSIVSKDLEACMQECFDMAGELMGIEAPQVVLDRDYDTQTLDGQQVGQYLSLWTQGAISHETLLQSLKRGEVLPDIDVEREIEMTEEEKVGSMMMSQAAPAAVADQSEDGSQNESAARSEVRGLVEERLRRLAQASNPQEGNN